MTTPGRRRTGAGFLLALVLGALTWGAWLGWDRTASYDSVTDSVQYPYVTLQVLGCGLTVLVLTVALAVRGPAVAAATGVGLGFWLGWTVDAASQDDTGLFAVGAIMLAIGLVAGLTPAALLGVWVRRLLAWRGRRDGTAQ
jgi:hypothetical protein